MRLTDESLRKNNRYLLEKELQKETKINESNLNTITFEDEQAITQVLCQGKAPEKFFQEWKKIC